MSMRGPSDTSKSNTSLPALSIVASPGKRRQILELAARAEELGFPALACPSLGGALGLCVSLAHETSRIRFYTAIQGIYGNAVGEIGALASHTHELSGGRFALGLGVSHEPMVRRTGAVMGPPLADMRNFVESLRSNARYGGELPPIYVAALRDRMLSLASEIGQGALWANASFRHTTGQVRRVPEASRESGFYLANMIPTVIDDDVRAAAAINRRTMTTYVKLPNYRNYWKAAGYVEEMNAIEAAIADGRSDELPSMMSDEWLADCTLAGGVDVVREGFARWRDIGVEPIAVMSSTTGGQVKAIGELFEIYR
jgi:alkanesulfonate monooxygenase SsuD/methylene tetrahydromethanopterin reductase-like flavin-dependent oxidoreductase (luciferase family)